jgi:adenosylcobinamide-GDP ribazoletransferase
MLRAIAFLTPFGPAAAPTGRTLVAFPVVGTLIGLAVGWSWWLTGEYFPALVAGALTVAVDVVLTGALHLDGLSDSADGLLPPVPRPRRVEIMRDPRAGAFGVITLVVVLLARFAVFASIPAAPWAVGALWCAARTAMAAIARIVPYARTDGGLASAFVAGDCPRSGWAVPLALGVVIAAPLSYLGARWVGILALGVAVAAAATVALVAHARIGGFTGDVLGAAGVLAETAGLIALAAA